MSPEEFDFLADLLRERSGLVLSADKSYLLESRLMPIARKRGLKSLEDLIAEAKTKGDKDLIVEITEAMTTNESFFFRDIRPFDMFRDVILPKMMENRGDKKSIRIWCAAASSGQEPYSLAMVLREQGILNQGWKVDILGTDLSNEILDKAVEGVYSQFEVQRGLPMQLMVKYFEKKNEGWQITKDVRSMVEYKQLNLLDDFAFLGKFDIVFCRNVLIYFDQQTKGRVLDGIANLMPDDGYLFLGGAETVIGISDRFKPVPDHRGIYAINSEAGAAAKPLKATATG
jgi:chemotaxis protein methyltransferase CheR